MSLARGTIVEVNLDPTLGHEQRGLRPAVMVSDPAVLSDQRFPMLCVVPITGTSGQGALYPRLEPGPSGLRKVSYALIDQLRSIDKRRIRRNYGRLTAEDLAQVDEGLRLYLGLDRLRGLTIPPG